MIDRSAAYTAQVYPGIELWNHGVVELYYRKCLALSAIVKSSDHPPTASHSSAHTLTTVTGFDLVTVDLDY